MVNEIHAVVEELGGHVTFGRTLRTEDDLRVAIRVGFPQTVVESRLFRFVAVMAGYSEPPCR